MGEEMLKKSLKKLQALEDEKKRQKIVFGQRRIDEKVEEEGRQKLLMATADVDELELREKYDDLDDEGGGSRGNGGWSDVEDDSETDLDASDDESRVSEDSDDESD